MVVHLYYYFLIVKIKKNCPYQNYIFLLINHRGYVHLYRLHLHFQIVCGYRETREISMLGLNSNMVIVHYYLRGVVRQAEQKSKGGGRGGVVYYAETGMRMRNLSILQEVERKVRLSRLDEGLTEADANISRLKKREQDF